MQLGDREIRMINDYFSEMKGIRFSDWVTEMRRSIAVILRKSDVSYARIGKLLRVDHTTVIHYTKLIPRPDVEKVVAENMIEWIENKLYPASAYFGKNNGYSYVLTTDLNDRPAVRIRARRKRSPKQKVIKVNISDIDALIDSL